MTAKKDVDKTPKAKKTPKPKRLKKDTLVEIARLKDLGKEGSYPAKTVLATMIVADGFKGKSTNLKVLCTKLLDGTADEAKAFTF